MQDPHNLSHQTYLNDLESLVSRGQKHPVQVDYSSELKGQVRGMAALATLIAVVVFFPWEFAFLG